jgi:hypothetical protein
MRAQPGSIFRRYFMVKVTVHLIVDDLDRAEVVGLRQQIETFLTGEPRAWLKVFVAEEILTPPAPPVP